MPADERTGVRYSQFSFRLRAAGRHLMAMSRVSSLDGRASGARDAATLTLERGIISDRHFLRWAESGAVDRGLRQPVDTRDLTLELYGMDGAVARGWTIRQAWAVAFIGGSAPLDGPTDVVVEQLVLRHAGAESLAG